MTKKTYAVRPLPFDLAIKREREIGVHPRYLHRAARLKAPKPEEWENMEVKWRDENSL